MENWVQVRKNWTNINIRELQNERKLICLKNW
jgi:hypothetical protein